MTSSKSVALLKEVCGEGSLPAFPEPMRLCLELATDDSTAPKFLAEAIADDVRINRRFLILANLFLQARRTAQNTQAACEQLAPTSIADILWILAITGVMQDHATGATRGGIRLWKHSLLTAAICHRIIKEQMISRPSGFVLAAGMAHDLGHLLMQGPALQRGIDWHHEHDCLVDQEGDLEPRRNHCLLGHGLLKLWNAPNELLETAQHHHRPETAEQSSRQLVALVRVADLIAEYLDRESEGGDLSLSDSSAWKILCSGSSLTSTDQLLTDVLIPSAQDMERMSGLLM